MKESYSKAFHKEAAFAAAPDDYWFDRFCDLLGFFEKTAYPTQESDFYTSLADMVIELTRCASANIYLLTADRQDYAMLAYGGNINDDIIAPYVCLPIDTGRLPDLMATHESIIMDFSNPHEQDINPDPGNHFGHVGAITVPILSNDIFLGIYSVLYKETHICDELEMLYLHAIGRLLGALINREVSRRKQFELHILEESRRMSSEIHDNLAQAISAARLEAEKAELSFESGDWDMLAKDLEGMERACGIASDLIRDELMALRAVSEPNESFLEGVSQMVERFCSQWSIPTVLKIEGITKDTLVSGRVRMQLLRILHEALSNVIRHAKARLVEVTLTGDDLNLFLSIRDDGRGFNPEKVTSERLGIHIMNERAGLLGGSLDIESRSDEGTCLHVRVPRFF